MLNVFMRQGTAKDLAGLEVSKLVRRTKAEQATDEALQKAALDNSLVAKCI